MPRATTWLDLRLGLFALLVVTALVVGVLTFARVGALHGAKTTIYMVSSEASGVLQGTEVWLEGQRVGTVRRIRFRPVTVDTAERLLIEMEILSGYMSHIRENSHVLIRPGASLIAEPVVALSGGTTNAPPLKAGDTLRALPRLAARPRAADLAALGDSVGAVKASFDRLVQDVRTTNNGPIEQLRRRTGAQAAAMEHTITHFSRRVAESESHGTVALTLHDTALRGAALRAIARGDSIRLLLSSGRTTLGRFRRDSTLLLEARRLIAATDRLRAQASGSLDPRSRGDSALVRQLERVRLQLDSLTADVRRHPFRYLPF